MAVLLFLLSKESPIPSDIQDAKGYTGFSAQTRWCFGRFLKSRYNAKICIIRKY